MQQYVAGSPTPPVPTPFSIGGGSARYGLTTGSSAFNPASNDSWHPRSRPLVGGSLQCSARQYSPTPMVRGREATSRPLVGGSLQFPVRQQSPTPMVREATPPPAYYRDVTPSPAYHRDGTPPLAYQRDPTPPAYLRDPTPPPAYHHQSQAAEAPTPPHPFSPLVAPHGATTPRMFGRMGNAAEQQQQQKQHMQQMPQMMQLQQSLGMPICIDAASRRSASSPPVSSAGSEGSGSRCSSFLVPRGSCGPYRRERDGGNLFRTIDQNRDGLVSAQEVDDWLSRRGQDHWTQVPPAISPAQHWSSRVPTAASRSMTPPASYNRTSTPADKRQQRDRSRNRRSHDSKWLLCCSNN